MFKLASRLLLSVSSVFLVLGAAFHGTAFKQAVQTIEGSNIPPYYGNRCSDGFRSRITTSKGHRREPSAMTIPALTYCDYELRSEWLPPELTNTVATLRSQPARRSAETVKQTFRMFLAHDMSAFSLC